MEQPPQKAGKVMLCFSQYPNIRKLMSVQQDYSVSLHVNHPHPEVTLCDDLLAWASDSWNKHSFSLFLSPLLPRFHFLHSFNSDHFCDIRATLQTEREHFNYRLWIKGKVLFLLLECVAVECWAKWVKLFICWLDVKVSDPKLMLNVNIFSQIN